MFKKTPCLYLISSTSGHCKIGYSNNPARRLKELRRTQGPYIFNIEYIWKFETEEQARFIEGKVHQMYSDNRVNGEWFIMSPGDLLELGSLRFYGMIE